MLQKLKNSAKNLKNTRVLCTAAIFTALFVILYAFKLAILPELRITFTFIPLALAGWLLGPVPAMLVGLVGDIIGCILFPSGAYFPGFTLTKLLSGFIYGIFLYRQNPKKNFLPVLFAEISVNMLMNVLLNALWLSVLFGKAWSVYVASHFIKNIFALPIEVILLLLIIRIFHTRGIERMYK